MAANKRKKKSTKTSGKKKSSAPAQKTNQASWYTYLTTILLGILSIAFLVQYSGLNDIINEHISEEEPYIPILEWMVYIGLMVIVARFAYLHYQKAGPNRWDRYTLIASFGLGVILYTLVLHPGLSDNGDNASYIINAKSLVEKGGAYQLHRVGEPKDVAASLGLPILLSPIYAIWGIDIMKMKTLIWLLGLACFPLLFLVFKHLKSYRVAAILTIVCFTHPVLFSSSSYIMTEGPFIFWSILSALCVMKYARSSTFSIPWLIAGFISMGMLYLTRAVGIGAFIAAALYLFLNLPLKQFWQDRSWSSIRSNLGFQKALAFIGPLFLGGVAYLTLNQLRGGSQIDLAAQFDIADNVKKSAILTWWILSQIVEFDNSIRWINFAKGVTQESLNFKWIFFNLVILGGMFRSIWRKEYIGLFAVSFLFVLYLFNPATISLMATSRYLMVLAPWLIYFTYQFILGLANWVGKKIDPLAIPIGKALGAVSLFYIMTTNFSGNSFFVTQTHFGHINIPPLEAYFNAANWCRFNLPPESIIASRKPRLFYIFSGLKGIGTTSHVREYNQEEDRKTIRNFQKQGVTHLILDRFSATTKRNVFPLIINNVDNFKLLHTVQVAGSECDVVNVVYDPPKTLPDSTSSSRQ